MGVSPPWAIWHHFSCSTTNGIRFAMWLLSISRYAFSSRSCRKQVTLFIGTPACSDYLHPVYLLINWLPFMMMILLVYLQCSCNVSFTSFLCLQFLLSLLVFSWFYVIGHHSRLKAQLFSALSAEQLAIWDSQFLSRMFLYAFGWSYWFWVPWTATSLSLGRRIAT